MEISIGTLSRAFQLSDEALRFYEKRGLLHPKRKEGSGYRVFEQADIQRVANIKRLKNQGFTLEEVQRVYSRENTDMSALYNQKIMEMQREIDYHVHVLNHMRRSADVLSHAEQWLMKPREVNMGRFYLLEYESIPAMWERLPHDPLLKHLFSQLPLTAYTTIIDRSALQGGAYGIRKGVLFMEEDAQVLGVETADFRCVDASRALCCLFRLENGVFDVNRLLEALLSALRDTEGAVADDLFTDQLISYSDERNSVVHYANMVVPLTPRA